MMGWGDEFATFFLTGLKLVLFLSQSQVMSFLKGKTVLAFKFWF